MEAITGEEAMYARKEFPQALARWFAVLNLHVE
jgi:hypothetical protein